MHNISPRKLRQGRSPGDDMCQSCLGPICMNQLRGAIHRNRLQTHSGMGLALCMKKVIYYIGSQTWIEKSMKISMQQQSVFVWIVSSNGNFGILILWCRRVNFIRGTDGVFRNITRLQMLKAFICIIGPVGYSNTLIDTANAYMYRSLLLTRKHTARRALTWHL